MSEEVIYTDYDKLKSHRIETTISGFYLSIWNAILEEESELPNLDEYLVTFVEKESKVEVYFTKPTKQLVLGGGNGLIVVNKETKEIIKRTFSK